ncbi:MAG: Cas9 inhibitor AcrIIA9 family protein [Eubacteriales bacterium]|nr:Cas9 inhibitor AcrIIA9 family protein [Eubacteriales bacterium]
MSQSIINKAIAHITEEMMKDPNDMAIVAIEEHLTSICTTEAVAVALLTEGKTLKGALGAIQEVARKRQKNGCGCVSGDEGFAIAEKYYGIDSQVASAPVHKTAAAINVLDFL